uniref:Protein with SprT-like domain at the N terminus n=1 Tax=Rhodnius prolixus TaxID=13249 RepID=T1HC16_RHOPR
MDSDLLLAKSLQEQFDREEIAERISKENKLTSKPTNSIIDPQWDLHDPTPDIYSLFQMFNAKFFWSQLDSVEVKWSPRMYSCAGICTYKGLGGCVVSLSLPLLKLRPRKDLVETLLVYHTFHDEVKHYKTHWWRCNGPCRSRPPYYGLVKRAMNRAPGPNDNWFAEHQRNCGGEFIKVKEPDGFKARKSKKAVGGKENSGKQSSLDKFLSPVHPSQSKIPKNISGMTSIDKKENNKVVTEKLSNNVHGFKGLGSTNLARPTAAKEVVNKSNGRIGSSGGLGLLSNRGGTLVERPRVTASTSSSSPKPPPLVQTTFTPYSGNGQILDPNCKPADINRANSRLLKLYPPANVKPSSSPPAKENPKKKTKIDENVTKISLLDDNSVVDDATKYLVNCPVCDKKLSQNQMNEHLDECINLDAVMESISETVVIEDDSDVLEDHDSNNKNVNCPNCNKLCKLDDINQHLDECLNTS